MRNNCNIIAAAILLCAFMITPALSISMSYSSGNGGESVSSFTTYNLDSSTALQEQSVLSEGGISQTREADGQGSNIINQAVSGSGFSASSNMASTGIFQTTSSASAGEGGADLSQNVAGSGDIEASVQGTSGSSAASQGAGVADGQLSTTQSLAASGAVFSSQNTALKGEAGSIASISSSSENDMSIAGGFSGEGDLQADLNAAASDEAVAGGEATFMGMPVLSNDDSMRIAASGEVAMTFDGLYEQPKGEIGSFGFSTSNLKKDRVGSETFSLITGPAISADGGSSSAYSLNGKRLNQKDPQIKFYLKDDANLRNEGLNPTAVASAIFAAANAWDEAVNPNLFADTNLVTISSSVIGDKYDGKYVASWKQYPTAYAIAGARTWYSYAKVDGYYSLLESDISFNTRYNWATNGGAGYDVQTVALHELGHVIGMGDIYGKTQFKTDTRQAMHYSSGIKRTLGNGDKTGAWVLYH